MALINNEEGIKALPNLPDQRPGRIDDDNVYAGRFVWFLVSREAGCFVFGNSEFVQDTEVPLVEKCHGGNDYNDPPSRILLPESSHADFGKHRFPAAGHNADDSALCLVPARERLSLPSAGFDFERPLYFCVRGLVLVGF